MCLSEEHRTQVIFPTGVMKAELPVLTLRDTLFESDEHLKGTLMRYQTAVTVEIGPDPSYVAIFDKAGEDALMYVYTNLIVDHQQDHNVFIH